MTDSIYTCDNIDREQRKKKTGFDKLSDESDEIAVQEKSIEQFRQEMIDSIFRAITKESTSSTDFEQRGDLLNAKLSEAKIEGLHKALSIMLEASTIIVKEGGDINGGN